MAGVVAVAGLTTTVVGWWSHLLTRVVSSAVAVERALLTIPMQMVLDLHQAAFWLELTHFMTMEVSLFSAIEIPLRAISVQI